MTDALATVEVFWDAEYRLWKSRRGEPGIKIQKHYDKNGWGAEVNGLPLNAKHSENLFKFRGKIKVEFHQVGRFVHIFAKAPAVRLGTPAAVAARLKREWGIAVAFRTDKFYGRDRRGRRKLLDVEPLKVVVGEQRIPSPEDP